MSISLQSGRGAPHPQLATAKLAGSVITNSNGQWPLAVRGPGSARRRVRLRAPEALTASMPTPRFDT